MPDVEGFEAWRSRALGLLPPSPEAVRRREDREQDREQDREARQADGGNGAGGDAPGAVAAARFVEACRATGAGDPGVDAIAAGLALHAGFVVDSPDGAVDAPALLFAAYLAALRGQQAHLVADDSYLAEAFVRAWTPVIRALGRTMALAEEGVPDEAVRDAYGHDIVVAGYRDLCSHHLRDGLRSSEGELLQARRDLALVMDVGWVLADVASDAVVLRGDDGGIVAHTWVRDYLRGYASVSGIGALTPLHREEVGLVLPGRTVLEVPPPDPDSLVRLPDRIFTSSRRRRDALVQEVGELTRAGRAVVVGAPGRKELRDISTALTRAGIPHALIDDDDGDTGLAGPVLTAAAVSGAVTLLRPSSVVGHRPAEDGATAARGGVRVYGVGRTASVKWDERLAALARVGGGPGEVQFLLSTEDPWVEGGSRGARLFGGRASRAADGSPADPRTVAALQEAQERSDRRTLAGHRGLYLLADAVRPHREDFLAMRTRVLRDDRVRDLVLDLFARYAGNTAAAADDAEELLGELQQLYPVGITRAQLDPVPAGAAGAAEGRHAWAETVVADLRTAHLSRMAGLGEDGARRFEREVLLSLMDRRWAEFLARMDAACEKAEAALPGSPPPAGGAAPVEVVVRDFASAVDELKREVDDGMAMDAVGYLFNVPPDSI